MLVDVPILTRKTTNSFDFNMHDKRTFGLRAKYGTIEHILHSHECFLEVCGLGSSAVGAQLSGKSKVKLVQILSDAASLNFRFVSMCLVTNTIPIYLVFEENFYGNRPCF